MADNAIHSPLRGVLARVLALLILAFFALLIGAAAVALAGKSPLLALQELIQGAVGTRTTLAATLTRSIPIVICGIAATIGFKAGLFNLGLEGQMVIGALTSAIIGSVLRDLPPAILLPLTILGGCAAGGLWALPAAWWQTRFKVPLLISSLLLNYIAIQLGSYMANYPFRDLEGGAAVARTPMIPESIQFGILLSGTRLHVGVVAIIILPLFVLWFFQRTGLGYQFRMNGLNPNFAAYGGINVTRMTLLAMVASGATAGLAGVIQVLGVDFRFVDTAIVAAGFAWTGFIAAILAQANPIIVLAAGVFLGGLEVGAAGMQRNTQIPLQIADVVQAGIIFMVALRGRIFEQVRRWVIPNG